MKRLFKYLISGQWLSLSKPLIICLALLSAAPACCQKYNFVNWTVEDGLIQSQASAICQDRFRQLWIGTQGGISKFDGKKFTGYTIQDGLVADPVNVLRCDDKGDLWIGTDFGISVFNGKTFSTIRLGNAPANSVTEIVNGTNGNTFLLSNYNLYLVNQRKAKRQQVSDAANERVTALYGGNGVSLMAYVIGKGAYAFYPSGWQLLAKSGELLKKKAVSCFFVTAAKDTLLGSGSGLFRLQGGTITAFSKELPADLSVLCMAEDQQKNLWLGTDKGVYRIGPGGISRFDAKSGFTDNSVNEICRDVENNLWFATDADGIYKFRENTFTYYDKSSGLSNTIVMGVVQTSDGSIYAAGYGGLYKINSRNDLEPAKGEVPVLVNSKINSLYADDENNLWVGTIGKGVWIYNEKKGAEKIEAANNPDLVLRSATCFLKDGRNHLLIGSGQGLFVRAANGDITRLELSKPVTSLLAFGNDTILVGTSKGVYLLDKNYKTSLIRSAELANASVLCLAKNNDYILVGTTDRGVLNWNSKSGRIVYYNTTNGLPSNFIYNLCVADHQKVWIGTGFGISNLQLDENNNLAAIKNYGRSDGLLGMECSHNCVLRAADKSLWFGTTRGLFHFDPTTGISEKNQPLMLLRSVKLFSADITDSSLFKSAGSWFNVPEGLKLRSGQNHLTFELGAIYFTDPEDVLYQYKLEGIDKDFTTSSNPYVIYPALPPGKYILKVRGITKSGGSSLNTIDYAFEIEKAFYQTRFFQLMIVLLLIATGAIITYVFTRGRQKRRQKAKELLEKIREEEFVKLRQRTAEDFHDEMGNNLTRISVLTDVLRSKIDPGESEVNKLMQQIKENTNALYNGSRDIIWSLNSQNDGLYEIAEHIKDIGIEVFQDTAVDFGYSHQVSPASRLKLKLDYSRNLIMIFKEIYNNILKHSGASQVDVAFRLTEASELDISITDNGRGFNLATVKQGNGIKNMSNRVNRLGGRINVESKPGKGTYIHIHLKNSFA